MQMLFKIHTYRTKAIIFSSIIAWYRILIRYTAEEFGGSYLCGPKSKPRKKKKINMFTIHSYRHLVQMPNGVGGWGFVSAEYNL